MYGDVFEMFTEIDEPKDLYNTARELFYATRLIKDEIISHESTDYSEHGIYTSRPADMMEYLTCVEAASVKFGRVFASAVDPEEEEEEKNEETESVQGDEDENKPPSSGTKVIFSKETSIQWYGDRSINKAFLVSAESYFNQRAFYKPSPVFEMEVLQHLGIDVRAENCIRGYALDREHMSKYGEKLIDFHIREISDNVWELTLDTEIVLNKLQP